MYLYLLVMSIKSIYEKKNWDFQCAIPVRGLSAFLGDESGSVGKNECTGLLVDDFGSYGSRTG